jgi:hypothetical protein
LGGLVNLLGAEAERQQWQQLETLWRQATGATMLPGDGKQLQRKEESPGKD